MAIMLNLRPKVYENIFFSASQPSDSSTILQPAGIAAPAPQGHFTLRRKAQSETPVAENRGFPPSRE